jgi:peptidyl-prolyl cis-trans isomerase B (cyclophilin B)
MLSKSSAPTLLLASLLSLTSLLAYLPEAQAQTSRTRLIAATKKEVVTDPIVTMETNKGTLKMRIYKKDAPITASNFIDLVQKGFYNGLTFHRYEPGFVIQGGDPKGDGTGGYIDPKTRHERNIPLEVKTENPNLTHSGPGIVAMARTAHPNSASSQFYITLAPAASLDGKYAVFGKVTEGLDVVMAIRKGDKIVKATVVEPASK